MKNKNNGAKPIYKPYLKGNVISGTAAKRGLSVLGMEVLFAFMFVLIATMATGGAHWITVSVNVLLVLGAAFAMYNAGAGKGEGDVGFAEIAQARLDSGKNVPDSEKDRCYNALKGFFSAAVGALPVFAIALLFSMIAHRQLVSMGVLPSWVAAYEQHEDIGAALAWYSEVSPVTLEDILRIIMRVFVFPFVNIAGADNYDAMYLVDRLSPLLVLIMPFFYGLGYLRGPHLRAMVHGNIRQNRRRHNRKERRAREKRALEMKQKKELV